MTLKITYGNDMRKGGLDGMGVRQFAASLKSSILDLEDMVDKLIIETESNAASIDEVISVLEDFESYFKSLQFSVDRKLKFIEENYEYDGE